jgi:cytoskeletal protein CcmA (bactofilin family)
MVLRKLTIRSDDVDRPSSEPGGGRPAGPAGGSLIGAGMVLTGDCRTSGPLRVDGHVKGDVHASQLEIGPEGRVDGDVTGGSDGGDQTVKIDGHVGGVVHAHRVEIGRDGAVGAGLRVTEALVRGRVSGPIHTEERLLLEETAVVDGDVTARRLGLKEGGQVFGTIRIGDRPPGGSRPGPKAGGDTAAPSAAPGTGEPAE